jgi:hypothetical protein
MDSLDDRDIVGINDRQRFDPSGLNPGLPEPGHRRATKNGGRQLHGNIDCKLGEKRRALRRLTTNRRHGNDAALAGYENLTPMVICRSLCDGPQQQDTWSHLGDNSLS